MQAPKKILMLNFEFPPIGGGAATANYFLLKEFAGRPDVEVDLITSKMGDFSEIEKFSERIRIFRLGVKKKNIHFWTSGEMASWTWHAYRLAHRLVQSTSYDVCHCWFSWPCGLIGYLLRHKVPYVVALRGSDVPGYNDRLKWLDRIFFRYVCRLVWHNAASVVALSRCLRDLAQETCHLQNIQVIYNGVEPFACTHTGQDAAMNVLFVGRLIPRKGLFYLLQAMKDLCAGSDGFRLTVVGDGPQREEMALFCLQEPLRGKVCFKGAVDREQMPALYRQADVLVIPSLEEALGNVTLEGMAAGLPIITTNTGAAEILDGNCIVVEKQDAGQIREALAFLKENPQMLDILGRQSRQLAESLNWRYAAEAYCRIYEGLGRETRPALQFTN